MVTLEQLEDYLDDQTWWQRTYWPIYRFFSRLGPRALYMEAKYFIQRGRRGYSDRDLWNANDHIARTAAGFLRNRGKDGVPGGFADDDESWEKTLERWAQVEADILWLMDEHLSDDPDRWQEWGDKDHQRRVDRANRLFGKYWMALWH